MGGGRRGYGASLTAELGAELAVGFNRGAPVPRCTCSTLKNLATMALLDQDIARDPERLMPITADLVQRLQTLVADLEVDLDAPLPDEVESAP
jgi:hypothetical protein